MHTCVHSLSSDIKKLRVEIDQIGKLVVYPNSERKLTKNITLMTFKKIEPHFSVKHIFCPVFQP